MVAGDCSEHAILAIAKLAAARDVATAVLVGDWLASPATLDALAALVAASARHARLAEGERAA